MTSSTNGAAQTVGYGYDLGGNTTSIMYPGNKVVTRVYSDAGELSSVKDWSNRTTGFGYDENSNQQTTTFPNTTAATQGFDAADRVMSVAHAKSGSNFATFTYGRDNADQLSSDVFNVTGGTSGTLSYAYSSLNQLSTVNSGVYGFDGADNLTKLTSGAALSYDSTNQASRATMLNGGTGYGFDLRGNRTSASPTVGQPLTYGYDQADRLKSITSTGSRSLAAGGWYHSLVVRADATVWTSGSDSNGQLGNDAALVNSTVPVQAQGLSGVTAVAGGWVHSLALRADGTVAAWGADNVYQLGDGPLTANVATPKTVAGLSGVVAIAAGSGHSVALKADGTVWAWGGNASGQVGDGTLTNRQTPFRVPGLSGVTAIAAGFDFTLALKGDGTVWSWGANASGQLGDGTTTQRSVPVRVGTLIGVTAIAANSGGAHGIALKSDGTVSAWGLNSNGQVGDNSTTNRTSPVPVTISGAVASIASGARHTLAVKTDGTALAWGLNDHYQLGDGTVTQRLTPVAVTGLGGVATLAAGFSSSLASKTDGTTTVWGYNSDGQLGTGNTTQVAAPTGVPAWGSSLSAVSASYAYNGDGLRVSKTVGGSTTPFTWDVAAGLPLALLEGTTSFIYDDRGLPIERVDAAGNASFFHHDQLGSTRAITDGTGTTLATYGYDSYGRITSQTGSLVQPFGYAGQYTDVESGLQYLRARYYEPATGGFLTRDPLVDATRSPHSYASGNPVNAADPAGLMTTLADLGNQYKSQAATAEARGDARGAARLRRQSEAACYAAELRQRLSALEVHALTKQKYGISFVLNTNGDWSQGSYLQPRAEPQNSVARYFRAAGRLATTVSGGSQVLCALSGGTFEGACATAAITGVIAFSAAGAAAIASGGNERDIFQAVCGTAGVFSPASRPFIGAGIGAACVAEAQLPS
jgi:RHS repeat-associated protein